jgi:hypothetical protein
MANGMTKNSTDTSKCEWRFSVLSDYLMTLYPGSFVVFERYNGI